jgi:hypothetical protein
MIGNGYHAILGDLSANRKLSRNGVRGDENAATFDETSLPLSGLLARKKFGLPRNPSRVDARRGDRFLQADFSLLIAARGRQMTSV